MFPLTLLILSKRLHLHVQNESDMPLKTQFLAFILHEGESNYFYPIYFDEIHVFCMKLYCYINCFQIKKILATPISYVVLNVFKVLEVTMGIC